MEKKKISNKYTLWMVVCLAVFVFRVTAQLIQKFYSFDFLPPFEAWYSGALAYNWLLASQIIIITVMIWVISAFARGSVKPKRKLGFWLVIFGSSYFAVMLLRLIAGFTFAANHYWFGAHIPAFFHIVLATFILLVGHFHFKYGKPKVNT